MSKGEYWKVLSGSSLPFRQLGTACVHRIALLWYGNLGDFFQDELVAFGRLELKC